jgi:cobalt-zinc-cadmium efflux system outer membrane protein
MPDRRIQLSGPALPEPVPLPSKISALSLADAEAIALNRNPSLAEAWAKVQSARGNWVQVGLYPNPVVGYQGTEIGNEGRAGQQGAYVSQEFVTGGKLRLNREVAGQEVARAEQQLQAQRLRVITDVRTAFYRALVAQLRVHSAERFRLQSEAVEKRAGALFEKKVGSRIQVLQSGTQVRLASLAVVRAKNEAVVTWRSLAAVMASPEMPLTALAGDPAQAMPEVAFEAALERLLRESPAMSVAVVNVQRARWAVEQAKAGRYPNVSAQVALQNDAATRDTIVSVQLGVPLPVFNRNQGNIDAAVAELAAAQAAVKRTELDLGNRLAAVFGRYLTARRQVQEYRADILPRAEETLKLTETSYAAGEENYLNVQLAQRTLFDAEFAYLDALRDAWEAHIALDGLLLSGALEEVR